MCNSPQEVVCNESRKGLKQFSFKISKSMTSLKYEYKARLNANHTPPQIFA